MSKLKTHLPLLILLISLTGYWLTAATHPSGYADSDELITTGYLLSVAHPPGYGLNIILIGLFQRLLFFLTPAVSSNLLAGIIHSLTLVILYLTGCQLLPNNHQLKHRLLLATGILIAGFNSLFWLYSSVIEVVSLGDLFVALFLYQTVSWLTRTPRHTWKSLIILSLTFGVGVGHLQSLILLGPALLLIYVVNSSSQKLSLIITQISAAVGLTLIAFLVSSALILPLNARHQSYSWTFPEGISGWWHMVTRQDYRGAYLDRNVVVEDPYTSGFNWTFIDRIPTYLITTWNHYAGLPSLLIIVGFYYSFRRLKRPIWLYLSLSFLIAGLLFGSYVSLSDYDPENLQFRLHAGTAQRQYLIGYTILGLISGLGMVEISKHLPGQLTFFTATTLLSATILANFGLANQKNNYLVYNYAATLLANAKPDSMIICASDFSCFSLYYQSLVEAKRPDVAVVSVNTKGRKNFLADHPEYLDYIYPENPSFSAHLTAFNLTRRPVYYTSLVQFDIDHLGLDGNPFYAVPHDYLIEISLTRPKEMQSPRFDNLITQISQAKIDHRDLHLLGFADYLASYYQILARYLTIYRYPIPAASALDYALFLNPNDPRVTDWRFRLDTLVHHMATTDTVATSSAGYLKLSTEYLLNSQLADAEAAARKAHYLAPTDPAPLESLLNLYQQYHYPLFAAWTKEHLQAITD